MQRFKKIFFITTLFFLTFGIAKDSLAVVLFQDNFDSNCTGAECFSTGCNLSYPTGWYQWGCDDSQATHVAGEIASNGRGGIGKSLKIWRADGYFGNYTGSLYLSNDAIGLGNNHIFMRYYQKIPTDFTFTGGTGAGGFKMWRWNTTGGDGEIYLNVLCSQADCSDKYLGIYRGDSWSTILSNSELMSVWDGNWHCFEWDMNLSTHVFNFYLDGVLTWSDSITGATGNFDFMQHFPIGNSNADHTWYSQGDWKAMEIDDFVLSTTYVGVDSSGDTIPPSTPTGLSII